MNLCFDSAQLLLSCWVWWAKTAILILDQLISLAARLSDGSAGLPGAVKNS